jgi:hypothetical protein
MKKIFTLISLAVVGTTFVSAQTERSVAVERDAVEASEFVNLSNSAFGVSKWEQPMNMLLYDNGSIVNMAGQGFGGADASSLHDGMMYLGFSNKFGSFRVADDVVVPAGETWSVDSIVVFGYQTGSTTTSTFTGIRLCVRNADPLTSPSSANVIWGDSTTNILDNTYFSNIYRTSSTSVTATNRPVMKIAAITIGLTIPTGTHWIDWTNEGTGASGPWCPPLTNANLTTGNAVVTDGAGNWDVLSDSVDATNNFLQQGLPFLIYGTKGSGVNELYANNNVSIFPNPMISSSTVTISDKVVKSSAGFSFVVYDLLGNVVRNTSSISSNTFTIQKGDMSTGVYVYEVLNGNDIVKRGKLSIQ